MAVNVRQLREQMLVRDVVLQRGGFLEVLRELVRDFWTEAEQAREPGDVDVGADAWHGELPKYRVEGACNVEEQEQHAHLSPLGEGNDLLDDVRGEVGADASELVVACRLYQVLVEPLAEQAMIDLAHDVADGYVAVVGAHGMGSFALPQF